MTRGSGLEDVEGARRAKRDLPSAIFGEFGEGFEMLAKVYTGFGRLATRWNAFEGSWITINVLLSTFAVPSLCFEIKSFALQVG